jgi:pyrimidine operon attenuation protein/uracil phosphoribosyltransferase
VIGRQVMSADELRRATLRISHEIVEKQAGTEKLALVGIQPRGGALAKRIAAAIAEHQGVEIPVGLLDPAGHPENASSDEGPSVDRPPGTIGTQLSFRLDGLTIVLVDDVLYTGRTVRTALQTLLEAGRPAAVRLAVLVDRGHRELPIRADHVGKNVPTSRDETVRVHLIEVDEEDGVEIERRIADPSGVPIA